MLGIFTQIRSIHATKFVKDCLSRPLTSRVSQTLRPSSWENMRYRGTVIFAGGIGLFSFALFDDQESKEDVMSVSSPGFCATWRRWSKSFGSGTVVAESVHISKGEGKRIEMSQKEFQFSPTLTYECFTIVENHSTNGNMFLAEQLKDRLPLSLSLTLGDAYSAAADAEPLSSRRNPGELPNPAPSSSVIDDAIQEAFELVNDTTTSTSQKSTASFAPENPLEGNSVIMGIFNSDDRSLRIAVNGTGRAVYGRRSTRTLESQEPSSQYHYELEQLTPDRVLAKGKLFVEWNNSGSSDDECTRNSPSTQVKCSANPTIAIKEDIRPGDFVVMGNRQFWDCLQNEETIGLIGLWLEKMGGSRPAAESSLGSQQDLARASSRMATYTLSDLPVQPTQNDPSKTISNTSDRKADDISSRVFVCEDRAISVHLMRNALRCGPRNTLSLTTNKEETLNATDKKSVDIGFTILFFQ